MKKDITVLAILVILMAFSVSLFGQDAVPSTVKKNNILASGSITAGLSVTGSYERLFFMDKTSIHKLFAKVDIGGLASINNKSGFIFGPHFGYLNGVDKHHFEASIGFYLLRDNDNHNFAQIYFRPSALIGYRMHKPGGWLITRTGLSYPLGAHIGFGVAF